MKKKKKKRAVGQPMLIFLKLCKRAKKQFKEMAVRKKENLGFI